MVRLDYEAFREYCMTNVVKILGDEARYTAELTAIVQTDEEHIDSVVINDAEVVSGTLLNFRPKQFYLDYYCAGKSLGETMLAITKHLEQDVEYSMDFDPDDILSFHKIETRLILRILNYNALKKTLQGHVFKRENDIALVLYIIASEDDKGRQTIKVPLDIFNSWGVPENYIMQFALENTVRMYPPILFPLEVAMMTGFSGDLSFKTIPHDQKFFMNPLFNYKLQPSMTHGYYLGVHGSPGGAIAPFYPGVMDRITGLMNDDVYVVFTNVTDCMIHAASALPLAQVKQLAKSQAAKTKFMTDSVDELTPSVYVYRRTTRTLEKA